MGGRSLAEARIRGGGTARLTRTTGARGRSGGRGRSARQRSWIDGLIDLLPVSEETLQRMASWTIVGIVLAALVGIAMLMGVPAMAGQKASELAAQAGFEVEKVEVRGVERVDELPIYNIALGQRSEEH